MSKWFGNKENGLELRYGDEGPPDNEVLDEVVLWVNGKAVMHMEAMSEVCYWFGFQVADQEIHMNISSKNLKSHIKAIAEDQG